MPSRRPTTTIATAARTVPRKTNTDASRITPSPPPTTAATREPPALAERDRREADRERRAGERAEVLVAEERHLALAGPRPLGARRRSPKNISTPQPAGRDRPGDEDGEEAVEVDRPPEEQHDRRARAARTRSIFAAVTRCFVGRSSGRQKHEIDEQREQRAGDEPEQRARAGAAPSRT